MKEHEITVLAEDLAELYVQTTIRWNDACGLITDHNMRKLEPNSLKISYAFIRETEARAAWDIMRRIMEMLPPSLYPIVWEHIKTA